MPEDAVDRQVDRQSTPASRRRRLWVWLRTIGADLGHLFKDESVGSRAAREDEPDPELTRDENAFPPKEHLEILAEIILAGYEAQGDSSSGSSARRQRS